MNNIYYDNNQEYFNQLKQISEKYSNFNTLYHSNRHLLVWLDKQLKNILITGKYNTATKAYLVLNGLQDFPICPVCKKHIYKNVMSFSTGFNKYCCQNCARISTDKAQLVSQILQSKTKEQKVQIAKKRAETKKQKYGSETYNNREKAKTTCLERYNVTNQNKLATCKDKIKATKLKKYGAENYTNKEKTKQTWLNRYGVDNPSKVECIKEKKKATFLQHYGVENVLQSKEIRTKITQTTLERYGVKSQMDRQDIKEKINIATKRRAYDNLFNNEYDSPAFTFDEFCNRKNDKELLKFKCKKCGNIYDAKHYDGFHIKCPKCYSSYYRISDKEHQLVEFIQNIVNSQQIKTNDRTILDGKYELDVYVPEKNIAIEFDGLYWHSTAQKNDNNYHLNKTTLCEAKGIQLIHIFENEWIYKQDIVKSRLKSFLGIYDKTIFARKCIVKEVLSNESRQFQEDNHIQGSVNAKVNLGLYYNNKLVSLMTFGKCRFDKKHEWEMLRFCNKLNYHILGAAGKLLKYFERTYQPKSIVSYADRRWSKGKLYKVLGFKLDHVSAPNYWYVFGDTIKSRLQFQKHKLKNILEKYNENLSEVENMKNNGYYRIFDCGNLVFSKYYF